MKKNFKLNLKITRHYLCCAMLAVIFALAYGCTKDPQPKNDDRTDDHVLEALYTNFESGAKLQSFSDFDANRYAVEFEGGSAVFLDKTEIISVFCTPSSWPVVKIGSNGKWIVENRATNIDLAQNAEDVSIVAAIYDSYGLYIRLSDASIIYFHPHDTKEIACFKFEAALNPSLDSDVECRIEGNRIMAIIPGSADKTSLIATFAGRGSFYIGSAKIRSGQTPVDYSQNLTFEYITQSGTIPYDVRVSELKPIPVVYINTKDNATIDRNNYVEATVKIVDSDLLYGSQELFETTTQIRGRGNSTWGMEKKPYKLKLSNKETIMGMSTDKEWALLANYSDKTLLRNAAVFEMSRILGFLWTPRFRPVELYLNGNYQGQYMFTEHVKVSSERVNTEIVTSSDNQAETISGGYFLEIDERFGEVWYFRTQRGLPINFKDPEEPTSAQYEYLKTYFQQAEDALYGADFRDAKKGYAQYIDQLSFARNYIIQELSKNVDGDMRLSNFLIKPRDGKIAHSHVWDFDLALGNCDYILNSSGIVDKTPENFIIRDVLWYERLMQDPAFVAIVKQEWNKLYSQSYQIESYIRYMALQVSNARKRNFEKWTILNRYVWPNAVVLGNYDAELEYMINFYKERSEWLNAKIQKW